MLLETRQGDTQSKMKNLINSNHYNICSLFMQKICLPRSNLVTDIILYFRQCPLSLGIRKVFKTKHSNI